MDRGTWQATVHRGPKELDTTQRLTLSLSEEKIGMLNGCLGRRGAGAGGAASWLSATISLHDPHCLLFIHIRDVPCSFM